MNTSKASRICGVQVCNGPAVEFFSDIRNSFTRIPAWWSDRKIDDISTKIVLIRKFTSLLFVSFQKKNTGRLTNRTTGIRVLLVLQVETIRTSSILRIRLNLFQGINWPLTPFLLLILSDKVRIPIADLLLYFPPLYINDGIELNHEIHKCVMMLRNYSVSMKELLKATHNFLWW